MTPEERARAFFGAWYIEGDLMPGLAETIRAAVAEERQACAKIAENLHEPPWHCNTCGGEDIAVLIRARA